MILAFKSRHFDPAQNKTTSICDKKKWIKIDDVGSAKIGGVLETHPVVTPYLQNRCNLLSTFSQFSKSAKPKQF